MQHRNIWPFLPQPHGSLVFEENSKILPNHSNASQNRNGRRGAFPLLLPRLQHAQCPSPLPGARLQSCALLSSPPAPLSWGGGRLGCATSATCLGELSFDNYTLRTKELEGHGKQVTAACSQGLEQIFFDHRVGLYRVEAEAE